MNTGSRTDHQQFCINEDWEKVRDARGGEVRHHVVFELVLHDGRILRTRVSRPVSKDSYGADLWKHILKSQLEVSEAEFWECVRNQVKPDRGGALEVHRQALPARLVHQLIQDARVPEDVVKQMTLEEALAAMNAHWSEPPGARD